MTLKGVRMMQPSVFKQHLNIIQPVLFEIVEFESKRYKKSNHRSIITSLQVAFYCSLFSKILTLNVEHQKKSFFYTQVYHYRLESRPLTHAHWYWLEAAHPLPKD